MNHDGTYGGENDAESSGWESLFGGSANAGNGGASFLGGRPQSAGGEYAFGVSGGGGHGAPSPAGGPMFEPVHRSRSQHNAGTYSAPASGGYTAPTNTGEDSLGYHDIEQYLLGPSGGYHAGGGGGGGEAGGGMQSYFAAGDSQPYSYHAAADGGQGHSVAATHTTYRPSHEYGHHHQQQGGGNGYDDLLGGTAAGGQGTEPHHALQQAQQHYADYYGTSTTAQGATAEGDYNRHSSAGSGQSQSAQGTGGYQAQHSQGLAPTLADFDFCDVLLRNMHAADAGGAEAPPAAQEEAEPSLSWLGGGFNSPPPPPAAAGGHNSWQTTAQSQAGHYGQASHRREASSSTKGYGYGAGNVGEEYKHHHRQPSLLQSNSARDKWASRRAAPQSSSSSRFSAPLPLSSSSAAIAATSAITSSSRHPNLSETSSRPSNTIDPLLETLSLTVSAMSLTPLSGNAVVRHVQSRTDDVITRFLPCVDFLVNCQQELRQGLQYATRTRRVTSASGRVRNVPAMTPREFHGRYVAPLPGRFVRINEGIMAGTHLAEARAALDELARDASDGASRGCESVKNAFLGGMRENESWGLRKWLSRHGGAGAICNDVEEVVRNVRSLPKTDEAARRLTAVLRPIARQAHGRLKKDVPAAYQEQSSAHPYLPFFHRLEACLKQMATYDPEEDDVICLSDSDDSVEPVVSKKIAKGRGSRKRDRPGAEEMRGGNVGDLIRACEEQAAENKRWRKGADDLFEESVGSGVACSPVKQAAEQAPQQADAEGASPAKRKVEVICLDLSSDEDDEDDAAGAKPPAAPRAPAVGVEMGGGGGCVGGTEFDNADGWRCPECTYLNRPGSKVCAMCDDDSDSDAAVRDAPDTFARKPIMSREAVQESDALSLRRLSSLVASGAAPAPLSGFGAGNVPGDGFWTSALSVSDLLLLLRDIVSDPAAAPLILPDDDPPASGRGRPNVVLRHPSVCLHSIVASLVGPAGEDRTSETGSGVLPPGPDDAPAVKSWCMWNGVHLIEAVDLVFLNAMARSGPKGRRKKGRGGGDAPSSFGGADRLRSSLWAGVNSMLARLEPAQRRLHLPQRRSPNSSFVVVK